MPFRSEKLVVLEKIRRAEDSAAELLDRQKELRGLLAARGRQRAAWLALFTGVILACGVGWIAGDLAADARAANIRRSIEAQEAGEVARGRSQVTECQVAADRSTAELASCQRGLMARARQLAMKPTPPEGAQACTCVDGDPMCACPLDRAEVAASLTAAQAPIRMCFMPPKAESFHARITFSPRSGQVERAVIDSSDGNLTEADKSCVLAVLQRVTVPPFGGMSVTVGKSFTVRGP